MCATSAGDCGSIGMAGSRVWLVCERAFRAFAGLTAQSRSRHTSPVLPSPPRPGRGGQARKRWLVSLPLLLLLVAAVEGRAADLFSQAHESVESTGPMAAETLRSRVVRIDFGPLRRAHEVVAGQPARTQEDYRRIVPERDALGPGTRLTVNLFDDVVRTAVVDRTAPALSGGYSLRGRIVGDPLGTLTMVVDGDALVGTIRLAGGVYYIRPAGPGLHAVSEVEEPALECGAEGGASWVPSAGERTPQSGGDVRGKSAGADARTALPEPPEAAEEPTEITVAFFYTPAVRRKWGGHEAIGNRIDVIVAEINGFYETSGVHQRLTLVAAEEVGDYVESPAGHQTDLRRLADPSDGYMDKVQEVRDRVWADAVMLLFDRRIAAAHIMTKLTSEFAPSAFGVSGTQSTTIAHELGHIMGLVHDRYVQCGTGTCNAGPTGASAVCPATRLAT